MAQERTLGYAPGREVEPSKEELQRRMEEARDSISTTVNDIKESVAHQVENVKDALDWREHFKKAPVAWTLGAAGVGFLAGYGLAAAIKGEDDDEYEYYGSLSAPKSYAARPILGEPLSAPSASMTAQSSENGGSADADKGPGLFERFKETSAYDKLSKEASSLGDRFVEELSSTAQTVVLPALLAKIKNWIGMDLSGKKQEAGTNQQTRGTTEPTQRNTYQPVLERPS